MSASAGAVVADAFEQRFDNFGRSLFRLETLDHYGVNVDMVERFLDGEPLPPEGKSAAWLDFVSSSVKAGKTIGRVHVLPSRLTPYLRYEIEWGYLYNARAGEDIRLIVDDAPADGLFKGLPYGDFWLIDDEVVADMAYGEDGEFLGGTLMDDTAYLAQCRAVRDRAIAKSVTLREFLREQRRR